MISSPAAISRLPRSLKVVGGIIGILAILDIVAAVAWAAGAPTDVVIPVWIGLLLMSWIASRCRRRHGRLGRKTQSCIGRCQPDHRAGEHRHHRERDGD